MFDELDEGTAILKFDKSTSVDEVKFLTRDMPRYHYPWLTGDAGTLFYADSAPMTADMPAR